MLLWQIVWLLVMQGNLFVAASSSLSPEPRASSKGDDEWCIRPLVDQVDTGQAADIKPLSNSTFITSPARCRQCLPDFSLVYLGAGFLDRSMVCMSYNETSGSYQASPKIMARISKDEDAMKLLNALKPNNTLKQSFLASEEVSPPVISQNFTGDSLLEEMHSLIDGQKALNQSQTWIEYLTLPPQNNTSGCATLTDQELKAERKDSWSDKDFKAYSTIASKGWGCQRCSWTTQASLFSVSQLNYVGNNSLQNEGVYLARHCLAVSTIDFQKNSYNGNLNFFDYLEQPSQPASFLNLNSKFKVNRCHSLIPHCAVCNKNKVPKCQLCMDGYTSQTITTQSGSKQESCVFDFCAQGQKQVKMVNGFTYCKPCQINNCSQCADMGLQTNNSLGINKTEVCLSCEGSFTLSSDLRSCVSVFAPPSGNSSTKVRKQSNIFTSTDVIVTGVQSSLSLADLNELKQKILEAENIGGPKTFIQQALQTLHNQSQEYQKMNGTLWLGKGEHHLLQCGDPATLEGQVTSELCSLQSLQAFYPLTDNLGIIVKPMYCLLTSPVKDMPGFNENCIKNQTLRPVIHVASPNFYFNITKQATFEDVIFDGLNAFSVVKDESSRQLESIYWPRVKCELEPGSLLQERAEGYGLLKFKRAFKYEQETRQTYLCKDKREFYSLYSDGAQSEFENVLKNLDPEGSGVSEEQEQILRELNLIEYESKRFNSCPDADKSRLKQRPNLQRRRTLFNLYAFTFQDSFQKNSEEKVEEGIIGNFMIPTLKLKNVEIRNFLGDYQSLIHVEKDNFITQEPSLPGEGRKIIHMGDYRKEAAIEIRDSSFKDSSFSLGMIYVPPLPQFNETGDFEYKYALNQRVEYAPNITAELELVKTQKKIYVQNSSFDNLNFGKVTNSLMEKDSKTRFANGRGMVISVHDYSGDIEFKQNLVTRNLEFIPSAIASSRPRPDDYQKMVTLKDFNHQNHEGRPRQINFEKLIGGKLLFLMNYLDPSSTIPQIKENYVTSSPIFISGPRGDKIEISGNNCSENVGMFGGVVHIELLEEGSELNITLARNRFDRNMAYFEGNAIFIKGSHFRTITIESSRFTRNFGLTAGIGAAISIDGQDNLSHLFGLIFGIPLSTEARPSALSIRYNSFEQNYAGQLGSAVNVQRIDKAKLVLSGNRFFNNTGAFSLFEEEHQLPFFKLLAQRKWTTNFLSHGLASECQNELAAMGREKCLGNKQVIDEVTQSIEQKASSNQFLYPSMRGVVFLNEIAKNTEISDSIFELNDAGPLLASDSPLLPLYGLNSQQRANSIFVLSSTRDVMIKNCTFRNNSIPFFDPLVNQWTTDAYSFFPEHYFSSSHSPVIAVHSARESESPATLRIEGCLFANQHNVQTVGLKPQKVYDLIPTYPASILEVALSRQPDARIVLTNNVFHNLKFTGSGTALVSIEDNGVLIVRENVFYKIGYLSNPQSTSFILPAVESLGLFEKGQKAKRYQDYGIFLLKGLISNEKIHEIKSNQFRKVYGHLSAIFQLRTMENQRLRVLLKHNFYEEVHGVHSGILEIAEPQNKDSAALKAMDFTQGFIILENEVVSRSNVIDPSGALLKAEHSDQRIAIVMRSCIFAEIALPLLSAKKVAVLINGSEFTSSKLSTVMNKAKVEQFDAYFQQQLRTHGVSFTTSSKEHYDASVEHLLVPEPIAVASLLAAQTKRQILHYIRLEQQDGSFDRVNEALFAELVEGVIISFGNNRGIKSILYDFLDNESVVGSIIKNSYFFNFPENMQLDSMFSLSKSHLTMSGCSVWDIQTACIDSQMSSTILVNKSSFNNLGDKIKFRKSQQTKSLDAPFWNQLMQGTNLTDKGQLEDPPSGFLKSQSSKVSIESSSFKNSVSATGLLYLKGPNQLMVTKSNFTGVTGIEQSAILFAIQTEDGDISFKDTNIYDTVSLSSMITLVGSRISMQKVYMISNFAQTSANGISFINSNGTLDECYITNKENPRELDSSILTEVESGFLHLDYRSAISIKQSKVVSLKGKVASFLISTGHSSVSISGSTEIKDQNSSSTISLSSPSQFEFLQSSMESSKGIRIYEMEGNTFLIKNSTINPFEDQPALEIKNSIGKIEGSKFIRANKNQGKSSNSNKRGIIIQGKLSEVELVNCTFANNQGQNSGAIKVEGAGKLKIKGCLFVNNSSPLGGALELYNSDSVTISNSTFINNRAEAQDGSRLNLNSDQDKYRGGAIYLDCQSQFANCDILLASNLFQDNYASIQGGAIAYRSIGFKTKGNTTFVNNTAGLHSNDVSSYASAIKVQFQAGSWFEPTRDLKMKTEKSKDLHEIVLQEEAEFPQVLMFPTGQPITVQIDLLDNQGVIMTHENRAKSRVIMAQRFQYAQQEIIDVILNNRVQVKNGMFIYPNFVIQSNFSHFCVIEVQITGLDQNGILKSFQEKPLQYLIYMRQCIAGEKFTKEGECVPCGFGFYLFFPPTGVVECKPCNDKAICYGMNLMAPKKGNWRSSVTSENLLECRNPNNCLGGDQENQTGKCLNSNTGFMCEQCKVGFFKDEMNNTCQKCRDTVQVRILAAIRVLFICLVLVALTELSQEIAFRKSLTLRTIVGFIKVFIQFSVLMNSISNVNFNFKPFLRNFLLQYNALYILGSELVRFECLLGTYGNQGFDMLRAKLIIVCLSPFITSAVTFVLYMFFKRVIFGINVNISRILICIMTLSILLLQPDIALFLSQAVSCIDQEGKKRLLKDLDFICWEGPHWSLIIQIALPGFLLWFVVVPLFWFWQFKKKQNNWILKKMWWGDDVLSSHEEYQIQKFLNKYCFMFCGLDQVRFPYYEFQMMYRKVFIVALIQIMTTFGSLYQCLTITILAAASMLIVTSSRPWQSLQIMSINKFSLFSFIMYNYVGAFYLVKFGEVKIFQWEDLFLVPMMLGPQFVFFYRLLKQFFLESSLYIILNHPRTFKMITLHKVDTNKFLRMRQQVQEEENELTQIIEGDQEEEEVDAEALQAVQAERSQVKFTRQNQRWDSAKSLTLKLNAKVQDRFNLLSYGNTAIVLVTKLSKMIIQNDNLQRANTEKITFLKYKLARLQRLTECGVWRVDEEIQRSTMYKKSMINMVKIVEEKGSLPIDKMRLQTATFMDMREDRQTPKNRKLFNLDFDKEEHVETEQARVPPIDFSSLDKTQDQLMAKEKEETKKKSKK